MHPFLFDFMLGGHHVRIPTYGIFLATAFTAAYFYSLRQSLRLGEDPRHIETFFLGVVLASVLGSRLFHVAFEEPGYYMRNPAKILALWEGGYTLYGALIASILSMLVVARLRRVSVLQFLDVAAPATALGIAIGRIGCFFAGCCWGRACDLPWAVTYRHPETFAGVRDVPVHPAQLYEAAFALAIFLFLHWRFRRRQYVGQLFFEGLLLYSIGRFVVEFFRGDDYRGYVFHGSVSYSQLVSLMILPFALVGMFLFSRRKPPEAPA